MATASTQKRVPLEAEDLARVRRLTEEVKGRLYEIGLIMGRTLGTDIGSGAVIKYESRPGEGSTDEDPQTVDVVFTKLPDGTFCCTQDPPGECLCPC